MIAGTATVVRGDARRLPLDDDTVDLVITSPPYFALRSYTDAGEHYAGQIGSEESPSAFLDALLEVTAECVRVLKPTGSLWVNLGDKYAGHSNGTGGHRALSRDTRAKQLRSTDHFGIPNKSLMGLPWRYAIRCIDELGLILRAEVIWSKPNGLPESVTDRVRRSHEQWFHFTLQPRYFSAVDEIREQHAAVSVRRAAPHRSSAGRREAEVYAGQSAQTLNLEQSLNPLGKLPGSVWVVPTEPLNVPDHLGIDHFAAFPTEWPKRIIQGWSPAGVCTACGEGRPSTVADHIRDRAAGSTGRPRKQDGRGDHRAGTGHKNEGYPHTIKVTHITGYACACPDASAPVTPAVVLDPFGGTGTTAMVAKALGRHGVSVDMSADYCRLAEWRTNDRNQISGVLARAAGRPKPAPISSDQGDLFDDVLAAADV